jgi:hypothetical protein
MTAQVIVWGQSTAVRQCGTLLGALGMRVTRVAATGADPQPGQAPAPGTPDPGSGRPAGDPNGVPGFHLDRFTEVAPAPQDVAALLNGADLLVTDRTFPLPLEDVLARGIDVVSLTPFGLTGPDSGALGGDLIASHAGGYAHYLTWSVDDPATTAPTRGPEGQAQLVAGLTGAVAAASRLVSRVRGGTPELIDVSEQESVTTLLLPQLSEHTEGTLKTGRHRARGGSKVAGGLVGLLRCADGWVIVSPREDHQWARMMGILGNPAWGSGEGAATAPVRMANWEDLQAKINTWSSGYPKEEVFRVFQEARIPCFPVNRVRDALGLEQLRVREFFYANEDGGKGPGVPFAVRNGRSA